MIAKHDGRAERRAEPLLIAMAVGIVGITGLVSALALVDEWWFLAATMATLLSSAGGVVALILRLLAQTGDPVRASDTARPPVAAAATEASLPRLRTVPTTPALRGA